MDYDVIIAGGSFAGLGVAAHLTGKRVLLIEPHTIGAIPTSACGTLLAVLEATGTTDSLIQIHHRILLHLGNRTVELALDYPFCTFDYATFCCGLLAQSDVQVLKASVIGRRGHVVYSTRGTFDAEVLVDATGWRAVLSSAPRLGGPPAARSFGLETTIPASGEDLHFYYDLARFGERKVGWLFPIGGETRAGIASYQGQTRLKSILDEFCASAMVRRSSKPHGGYFPFHRRAPTLDFVFRVGDSAGQCLPLTGEGIRPALFFAAVAGKLISGVLAGEFQQSTALNRYRRVVRQHFGVFTILQAGQWLLPGLPQPWLGAVAGALQHEPVLSPLLRGYWHYADPANLATPEGAASGSLRMAIGDTDTRTQLKVEALHR